MAAAARDTYVLESNDYGKTNVRVLRVVRGSATGTASSASAAAAAAAAKPDTVLEMTVQVLLEGVGLGRSYTHADNRAVVPTDTVKNTVFAMAKEAPSAGSGSGPEAFAAHTAAHFCAFYGHVTAATVEVSSVEWVRATVRGKAHPHAWSQGNTVRTAKARAEGPAWVEGEKSAAAEAPSRTPTVVSLEGGVRDLVVLKTRGSGWENYHTCKFTTLKPAKDRLLSTSVLATWTFAKPGQWASTDFDAIYDTNIDKLIELFATEYSPGVQASVWVIGTAILDTSDAMESIYFSLPNKHYWHYDIERFGYENKDEVYAPQTDPSGLIQGRITRSGPKARL